MTGPARTPANPPRGAAMALQAVAILAAVVALTLISRYSFPLFHALIELFAAAVALAIFFVTWHSRRFLDEHYVGVIGMAYLGVAVIGILHTLAYKGTNAFPGATNDLPTQLWLADRYLVAIAFAVAPFFARRRTDLRWVLAAVVAFTTAQLAAVFAGVFPHAWVEGAGLTAFKVASEYLVVAVLLVGLVLLTRVRDTLEPAVFRLLGFSIVLTAGAELAFTLYADPFGASNLVGHLLYAGAAYLVYRALVHAALEDPYAVLFRRIKLRESALERAGSLSDGLTQIVTGVVSSLDFGTVMQRTVDMAAQTAEASAVVVSVPDDGRWVVRYVSDPAAGAVGGELDAEAAAHTAAAAQSGDAIADGAFLSVPLLARGDVIGVLTFRHAEPRDFADVEVNFARKLAVAVSLAAENARLYEAEHEIAEVLQTGLKPQLEVVAGVEAGYAYQSAPGVGRLGGDFFDVYPVDDTRVAFMIGDVSGKGIRAATTTATVRGAARALSYTDPEPVPVLDGLNRTLARRGLDAGFVTLLYGTLDVVSGIMHVGIAGHPVPVFCDRATQPALADSVDPPLGLFAERTYHSTEIRLSRGERLVMFTDGLIDARGDGAPFGEERALEVLECVGARDTWAIAEDLAAAAVRHAGGRILDDVAVLAMRFTGGAGM